MPFSKPAHGRGLNSLAVSTAVLIAALSPAGVSAWHVSTHQLACERFASRSAACTHAARHRSGGGALRMVSAAESVPATGAAYDKAAWMRGWESVTEENDVYTVPADRIQGEVPADLVGTYYRNGPALFEMGETKLAHPLDGDGMVAAWTFSGDGTCTFRNRFVRTVAHVKEQNALKKGYTGPPITRSFFSGGKGDAKNPANTGVVHWGKRLLALYEAALPIELEPAGLHTVGETRIVKSLPSKSSFTARPKYDPASDR